MKNNDQLANIKESLLAVMRKQERWLLLVGTGASVDLDTELGMPALAKHLVNAIQDNTPGWNSIKTKLLQNEDLETALTGIDATDSLQNEIARSTAAFIVKKDAALRESVLFGNKQWVADPLLKQLMRGLSPTWPRLPIITPNYDMLIEYACTKANIPYVTGYLGGILRHQDWAKARERLYRYTSVTMGGKRQNKIYPIQCVELMKVHGSINLFRNDSEGTFVESDIWTVNCPPGYTPMIAPPGDTKTQKVLNNHDPLFGEALQAIDKATAFFVIGYGFRDEHIHQKILNRIRNSECPLIVLTLDPSKELNKLPTIGKNTWVITGRPNQITGKTDSSGTRFSNGNPKLSGDFDGVSLWKSDVFTKQILGG